MRKNTYWNLVSIYWNEVVLSIQIKVKIMQKLMEEKNYSVVTEFVKNHPRKLFRIDIEEIKN